jgi:hypothetical protein
MPDKVAATVPVRSIFGNFDDFCRGDIRALIAALQNNA